MGFLALLVEPLLVVRRALREQIVILHRRLLAIVRDDEVCRRLMTTPGALRSVLLICAFSTGNSASARALNSHCDNGPASNPIRLKQ